MTTLERLPRTAAGNIRKKDATAWLESLPEPTDEDILTTVVPKRYGETGKTFAKPISNIRIKGDAAFVEAVAGRFRAFNDLDINPTRLDISVGKVKDKQTGEETDVWRLYLSAQERGRGKRFT